MKHVQSFNIFLVIRLVLVYLCVTFSLAHANEHNEITKENQPKISTNPAQQLTDILTQFSNFRGNFIQTTLNANGRSTNTQRGTLAVQRPNKFRWDVISPIPLLVVSDGNEVFVYDQELAQVTVHDLDPSQIDTPATLLSGDPSKVEQNFVVTKENIGNVQRFQLIPRSTSNPFTSIIIVFSQGELTELEMKDSFGQFSIVQLDNFSSNTAIDDQIFRFIAPQGVDIFRNALSQ